MDGMHLRTATIAREIGSETLLRRRISNVDIGRAMRRAVLSRIIERDVIPELLGGVLPEQWSALEREHETAELTALALGPSGSGVVEYVAELHARGRSAESLCLQLLTAAARRLGDRWVDDTCDFTEVTIGVWRLQDAMRLLCPPAATARIGSRTALLMPLPGEQHTFGIAMVNEFFRRAGWETPGCGTGTGDELKALVRAKHLDLIGFSVSADDSLDAVRALVTSVRSLSANPDLIVFVGGGPFLANADLTRAVGADGSAGDAAAAVARADEILVARAPPHQYRRQ